MLVTVERQHSEVWVSKPALELEKNISNSVFFPEK